MASSATSYSDFYKKNDSTPDTMAENASSSTSPAQEVKDQNDPYGNSLRKKALQRRLKRMKLRSS